MTGFFSFTTLHGALHLNFPDVGMPEILGWGPVSGDGATVAERASRINGMDQPPPAAVLLPTGGAGFFGWPALAGHRDGRDFVLQFSAWRSEVTATILTLQAEDILARLSLEISITLYPGAVLAMQTKLTNAGDGVFTLDRCMAGSMVAPAGPLTLTRFAGMWGREFGLRHHECPEGLWLQESRRGRTSHDRFPGFILAQGDKRMAMHLGFSGNHLLAIDTLDDGRRLLHAGELFEPGEGRLGPGEAYESPTLYFAHDPADLRQLVREHLLRWPGGTTSPRKVTLNSWEGNYFDHCIERLKAQIDAAADLGIERFVLDDGWFGHRDDDTSGLGDWFVDQRKYPNGLMPLIAHTAARGLDFGIWLEPEMVNPDSDLYRMHPEWALQIEGRPILTSRNQLVLNLTRADVFDYLYKCIDSVLTDHAIDYVKWDMNRDLTFAGGIEGRAATSRQTRAVYALMSKIRSAHPNVEIETCASGGGRADYGVLRHTHRIWTSDCTDPLERLDIQNGARMFFPPEILGAHVSASPNHQTHRITTLDFRALVAFAYHFGVELDPTKLDPADKAKLGEWVALHKRWRPLLHNPAAQFCLPPLDGRYVWGARDDRHAVVIVAQGAQMRSEQPPPLTVPLGAPAQRRWRVVQTHPAQPDFIRVSQGQKQMLMGERDISTFEIAEAGINLPMLRPESGVVLTLEAVG